MLDTKYLNKLLEEIKGIKSQHTKNQCRNYKEYF